MAIDQREALIAAVRAQVEKEKAAKAAKLKKEQEAAKLAGVELADDKADDNKPKYKTLSAEDLAKIEEKKRRKYAAEHGRHSAVLLLRQRCHTQHTSADSAPANLRAACISGTERRS